MAGIPSNCAINVAKAHPTQKQFGTDKPRYLHYVAVELGQRPADEAMAIFADTKARYPAPEFSVTMTHWRCTGHEITAD